MALGTPLAAEAATLPSAYDGSAYGSYVAVGSVNAGKSSYVTLCTTKTPVTRTANAAGLNLAGVATVGAVTSKVRSYKSASGKTRKSITTTETAGANLLGGLITASAIKTEATATRKNTAYSTSGKTTLVGLKILGIPFSVTPGKNTITTIPGIANIKLNGQATSTSYGNHTINVVGLRVTLLPGNPLDLGEGTIVVGAARASIHKPIHNRPYGFAYGSKVSLGGALNSGPTAAVYIPCGGSDSKTRTNSAASGNLSGIINAAALKTTAKSTDSSSKTTATTTAKTAHVDLLSGAVTLDAITAKAAVTRKGKKVSMSSSGTSLVGLKVLGHPVTINIKENTTVNVAGIGKLYLRRAVKTSTGVTVYAVQLKLTTDVDGVAAGTVLSVGVANAGVTYK